METVFSLEGAVSDFLDLRDQLSLATASTWLLSRHAMHVTRLALRSPYDIDCSPAKKARLTPRPRTPVSFLSTSPASSPRSARAGPSSPRQPPPVSLVRHIINYAVQAVGLASSPRSTGAEAATGQKQEGQQEPKQGPVSRLLIRHPRIHTLRLCTQSTVAPAVSAILSMPALPSLHNLIVTKVSLEGLLDAHLLAKALPHLPELQVLDISHNCLMQHAGIALGQALECGTCCPRLIELGLGGWGNRLGAKGLSALAEGLERRWTPMDGDARPAAALTRLSLGADQEEVKEGALDALWPAVLPGLEELELWSAGVGRGLLEGLTRGLGSVGGAPRLRVLRVRSKMEGGTSGVEAMLGGLLAAPSPAEGGDGGGSQPRQCPAPCLEVLELWQCSMVAEAAEALAAAWPPALRELRLRRSGLRDNEVRALRVGCMANGAVTKALQVLDLSGHPEMCEESGNALGQALQHGGCPNLQVLDLAETRLGDGGSEALAKSLACAPCGRVLRRLVLGHTGLSGAGVSAVMAAAAELVELEELELWGNPEMGPGGIRAVTLALQAGALEALRVLDLSNVGLVQGEEAEALAAAVEAGAGRRLQMLRVARGGGEAVRRVVQAAANRRGDAYSSLQVIT